MYLLILDYLSAPQTLVFELVNDYAQGIEKISVQADFENYTVMKLMKNYSKAS